MLFWKFYRNIQTGLTFILLQMMRSHPFNVWRSRKHVSCCRSLIQPRERRRSGVVTFFTLLWFWWRCVVLAAWPYLDSVTVTHQNWLPPFCQGDFPHCDSCWMQSPTAAFQSQDSPLSHCSFQDYHFCSFISASSHVSNVGKSQSLLVIPHEVAILLTHLIPPVTFAKDNNDLSKGRSSKK